MALGAIQAIRECRLSVPEDISVIGFDDLIGKIVLEINLRMC
jgi:DNA-binding LacI/PurR family transcriptional regulator